MPSINSQKILFIHSNSTKQLDGKMWAGEDEELQTIFNEMKEVQNVLSSLK